MTLRLLIHEVLGAVVDIEARHIAAIDGELLGSTGDLNYERRLPHDLSIYVRRSRIVVRIGSRPSRDRWEETNLSVPGSTVLPVGKISALPLPPMAVDDLAAMGAVIGPCHAVCDARAVGDELTVRSRQKGDRFRPLGSTGSKKVQDLFVDRKIPAQDRDSVPIVCNTSHIVWIAGLALDRRVASSTATAGLVHLVFEPISPL